MNFQLSTRASLPAFFVSVLAMFLLQALTPVQARTWTSADGSRSFEGELESYDPATGVLQVTINGQVGSFNHAILSTADIVYLEGLGKFKREKRRPEPLAETESPSASGNGASSKLASANKQPAGSFNVPPQALDLIDYYCIDCHEDGTEKGGMRFDNLESHSLDGWVETLNKMQEQIHLGYMPPKDEDQLTEEERGQILSWLSQELRSLNADKLQEKLMQPDYGNYVNHEKLFSGEHRELKPFTPGRRWLVSEFIFDAKINRILGYQPQRDIDGKRETVIGDNNRRSNITNPFLLPTHSGVRYYANTSLNGGHLLTMITNAKQAAESMVELAGSDKTYLPAVNVIMEQQDRHNGILASRESFLDDFIERVLLDIYGSKHRSLLPDFESVVDGKYELEAEEGGAKKAIFHSASPGGDQLVEIFHTMRRLEKDGESEAKLLEKCERAWFYLGYNERKIKGRLTFMKNYMERLRQEFADHRYDQKHKLPQYRPLDDSEMRIIKETILAQRQQGDRYHEIIRKCMSVWEDGFSKERAAAGPVSQDQIDALIDQLFVKMLERAPGDEELKKYGVLTRSYFENLDNLKGIQKLIQTLYLRSDFVYRSEFGEGREDAHGRRMLSPREASYAISYALTDSSPDQELKQAAESGRLDTREDYRREVLRLLAERDQYYIIDESVEKLDRTASITNLPIRKLRFFREFFGYPNLLPIFKDNKRFGGNYDKSKGRLVGEADRLVEHILKRDQKVFEELLTTEDFYVYHSGDNEAMTASSERVRSIYEYFKDLKWREFEGEDLLEHSDFLIKANLRGVLTSDLKKKKVSKRALREFTTALESFTLRFDKGETAAAPYVSFPAHGKGNSATRTGLNMASEEVAKFFNIKLADWNYPSVQPAKVENRKGMLTHPAWLIAHAQNTETDPVVRGKWVREKLLAGTVPDIPITVDAVIPEDHTKTLRQRLVNKTEQPECWKCHVKMNPLGYTFEMYDDFGRFRTEESIEHPENLIEKRPDKGASHIDLRDIYKTMKVNPRGHLSGTGDKNLDGDVDGAIDLAGRLGRSEKVRQSIIRHAFRFFMGRNEWLSDSATLIDADRAYIESGGSFDAVIVSLLTSDSFIYRKSNH